MKILYIAYSCSPYRGSEDRIGWKIPLAAAENHEVFVITKEEHRSEIEAYCTARTLPPIQFYYADIPAAAKTVFRGMAYSLRLNLWHRRAMVLAEELCRREEIDMIHQITPVEFRSIGDYGRIPGVRFLCGPVGGGEYVPAELLRYAGCHVPAEAVRLLLNGLARHRLERRGILRHCDGLLFANRETEKWLSPVMNETASFGICPEVGIEAAEITEKSAAVPDTCTILAASRLVYRKGHALLLDALAELPQQLQWKLCIVGEGPEEKRLKKQCEKLGLSHRVTFLGKLPFFRMEEIYGAADLLVLPSLRETTGSVVLEAMARGIPVVTSGRFGGGELVTEETGWLYDGTPGALADVLQEAISYPRQRQQRGKMAAAAAVHHTWAEKVAHYERLYEKLLSPEE